MPQDAVLLADVATNGTIGLSRRKDLRPEGGYLTRAQADAEYHFAPPAHSGPRRLIGVGAFATRAAQRAIRPLPDRERPRTVQILHPSPASPAANRGWAPAAAAALVDAGIWD